MIQGLKVVGLSVSMHCLQRQCKNTLQNRKIRMVFEDLPAFDYFILDDLPVFDYFNKLFLSSTLGVIRATRGILGVSQIVVSHSKMNYFQTPAVISYKICFKCDEHTLNLLRYDLNRKK